MYARFPANPDIYQEKGGDHSCQLIAQIESVPTNCVVTFLEGNVLLRETSLATPYPHVPVRANGNLPLRVLSTGRRLCEMLCIKG